jgi:hypothetical protein
MIDMIETLRDVLAGSRGSCGILADWLAEYCSNHPEFATYHKRLIDPDKLRLQTLIDVIVKFGDKKQRSEVARMIRQMLRDKKRNNSKGTVRAYMKKQWSLRTEWFAVKFLQEKLGVAKLIQEREAHRAAREALKEVSSE